MDKEEPISFVPYGTRLGANPLGIVSTITVIDHKFPQCVCVKIDESKNTKEDATKK